MSPPESKPGDKPLPAIEITQFRVASIATDHGPRLVLEFLDDDERLYRVAFDERETSSLLDDLRTVIVGTWPKKSEGGVH